LAQADRIDPAIDDKFLTAKRNGDDTEPMKTPNNNLSL
jgi:hypothetical protein